jgi:hypothetical protein
LKKKILIGGGIFAIFILFIILKKSQAQPVIIQSGDSSSSLPSFTPSAYSFSPIVSSPVSTESSHNNSEIPGAPSQSINLPTVQPVQVQQSQPPSFQAPENNCALCNAVSNIASNTTALNSTQNNQQNLTSTQSFVEQQYETLFGRTADKEGLQFWSNAIDSGTLKMSDATKNIAQGAVGNDITAVHDKFGASFDKK